MATHTYKSVGDLQIKMEVDGGGTGMARPLVVWIHGGALIMGNRVRGAERIRNMMLEAGYAVASIDYRLAPETKLPGIIEDVEDAFAWIRGDGSSRLGLDTRRIAVMGGSAGGYLTLATGYRVQPRPTVLVAFWGYGDLIGDWYSKPSRHPRHNKVKVNREEAEAQVNGPPIANEEERQGNGGIFYQHCRQHGLWPLAVSGWDPLTEAAKFRPYMPVCNVTMEYPPTMLIHGIEDTDVPCEQSQMMAEQLMAKGVEHELITVAGAEHGLSGGDSALVDAAYQSALDFVNRHMKGAGGP